MPDETLELVEEHLAMCDWCRDYLDQIETTARVVGAAADGPDARRRRRRSRRCVGAFRARTRRRRRAVIAYKFLCAGGVGPFSRYAWPLPRDGGAGAWVAAAPRPCSADGPCTRAASATCPGGCRTSCGRPSSTAR